MHNYSSAKFKVLALKWVETEKLRTYLLGSWFTVLTDNNPLAHAKESKLGDAQICWPSELALYDIKYWNGKINLAAYALSCHLHNPDSELKENNEDDEYESLAYSTFCQLLGEGTSGLKLDRELKIRIQEEEMKNCTVGKTSSEVKVLYNITPDKMRKAQMEDKDLAGMIKYMEMHDKAPLYAKIRKSSHHKIFITVW